MQYVGMYMRSNVFLFAVLIGTLFLIAGATGITANFSAKITTGEAPLTVKFADKSTGSPMGWAWFFGDENYTAPWTQVNASAGWSGRHGLSSAVLPDGSFVIMGGSGYTNDTWRSTDKGATWTEVNASSGWSGRVAHSSVGLPDGSIVLMGGYGVDFKNDVWRSTDKGATWTRVNKSAGWSARYSHSSVVMPDGSIILIGGGDGNFVFWNDVWRSTDKGATWTRVTAGAGWSARQYHSSVVLPDGSIVIMGGWAHGSGYMNDVWRSTNFGATWTRVNNSAGWSARVGHTSAVLPDGSILLMGGYNGNYLNDVWRSTDKGATWTEVDSVPGWSGRFGHTSVVLPDGNIVLMGGSDGILPQKNDVWRLMAAGSSAQNPSHIYTKKGTYNVALQVFNANGYNSTRKLGYIKIILRPAPTVIAIKPASGNWGRTVQITDLIGTGFVNGAKIYLTKTGSTPINATNISVVSPTNTTCTFRIPLYAAIGPWNVRVTNTDGRSGTKANAFVVKTPAPPTVTGITPASAVRGTTVQITYLAGKGFALKPKPTVQLVKNTNTINATNITVINPNRMTCTFTISPYAATGPWDVKVTNADMQSGVKTGAFIVEN
jgi:PKD repeat protein